MTSEVKQLIDDTIDLLGVAPPSLLNPDAPLLASPSGSIYLIGLVGGKEVGKSSLVNAIVGTQLSKPTSHGPGTETVIAYAHESAADELRDLLESEVPGQFSIVTHRAAALSRQILLDLPDIDSRHANHVQITRKMLRHMLYPLWIQSIEKYADKQPQELLKLVAQGNDPTNFIFCLNKADQLPLTQAEEIRNDFAARIAKSLNLKSPPKVYLISAARPNEFDLPVLKEILSRGKSDNVIQISQSLAERRQDRSLLDWLDQKHLSQHSDQLARLQEDAEELTASRIVIPLVERAIPRMLDDPGQRMALVAPAIRARMSRWPIVNAIDALFAPLLALVQKNLSTSPTGSADPDAYLDSKISSLVQTTFAQLYQLHPQLSALYEHRKLWESMHVDASANDLRLRFADSIETQRQAIMQRAVGRFNFLFVPLRWLLTIGAILWFPIVQPILHLMLQQNVYDFSKQTLLAFVDVLSVSHLLQCTTFLVMWFLILWIFLRWSTQRSVNRIIECWKDADEDASLASQTKQWIDEMLEPIRRRRERVDEIIQRAQALRKNINADAPTTDRVEVLAAAS
jgi:GTPase Era involved in 16S rRNA processing